MSKTFRHIAVMVFLTTLGARAHAQVVAIRLEIPAGINFSAQVLDPMEGGTWENSKAKAWIGIEAHENLTFLLDLEFPEREILPHPEAHFLNDGSADFETARMLSAGSHELQMKNLPRLIRNMEPRPSHLQAWLGLPILNGIKIKIEYP